MKEIISFDDIDQHGPRDYHGSYTFSIEELAREEVVEPAACRIDVEVSKGDLPGEYVMEGTSVLNVALGCSRCLDPTLFANSSPVHVLFRVRPASSKEDEEVEITAEDELDVEYYSEREIELRDLALEQVQLSIPMKTLCKEECAGLCPQCGANRNQEGCQCDATARDPRWDALRGIREELAKKKES